MIENYLYYLIIGVEFCFSLMFLIINFCVSNKKNKIIQDDTKQIKYLSIAHNLADYIKEAESLFGAGNGAAKLNYVLNKIHILCLEQGLNYSEDVFKTDVETILSTPQKKEDVDNG